ncbi:twin-arginine translocase subunit TatC [Phytohabitans houttuyneae]|uniref:Sec-independent protein translocase protein TatC n=1 Tax=Phytohabitans houttuyneae TaxID=1076126 RepID=A0A6V8KN85_9ACTN|nr:twin-arginine translocase subunit TatC [Phytohabitans houttuyneae]GFJ83217.1 Sec-independent protein translocase protein TatC [Phytohabitans houttuyneae]
MAFSLLRRGPSNFERAADGSMTLIEHLRELRTRLFRASLGILIGFIVGFAMSNWVMDIMDNPYCALPQSKDPVSGKCMLLQLGPADVLLLQLRISLWLGLIVAGPIWLYQLWAFIAPGLHRHERRYAYAFAAIAAPLFAAGGFLAFFVVHTGLEFLLNIGPENIQTTLEVSRYFGFVTNLILIFGVAFEFPLIILMLNLVGLASAKRLLSWWRVAIFAFFAFSAIATPTPDPFGMTALALCLCVLYFAAVGVAFVNDRRKRRRQETFAGLDDDEASPLEYDADAVEAGEPLEAVAPVPAPLPIERRFDETT